jgi:uncharacterized protein RhaS with RHS repeats
MRKKLIISAIILCSITIFAQDKDNPYSMFGYDPKISDVISSKTELFYLDNTDTTALVQTLAFDFEKGYVYLYDTNNQMLDVLLFDKKEIARFTTIDPHAENYLGVSPYAYVINNPVRNIDPDGRDVWEMNGQGEIVNRIKDRTQDAFYMVAQDADGNYQRTFTTDAEGNRNYNSISFKYGTVESQRTIGINSTQSYDVYKVRAFIFSK